MIRRDFPKGSDSTPVSEESIKKIELWMNEYPRAIFEFQSADDMFEKCMAAYA